MEWSFEEQLFFSHGKTNCCGVAIGFMGTNPLNILNIKRDNLGRINQRHIICKIDSRKSPEHIVNDFYIFMWLYL